jgi:hypothetical protein
MLKIKVGGVAAVVAVAAPTG